MYSTRYTASPCSLLQGDRCRDDFEKCRKKPIKYSGLPKQKNAFQLVCTNIRHYIYAKLQSHALLSFMRNRSVTPDQFHILQFANKNSIAYLNRMLGLTFQFQNQIHTKLNPIHFPPGEKGRLDRGTLQRCGKHLHLAKKKENKREAGVLFCNGNGILYLSGSLSIQRQRFAHQACVSHECKE